MTDAQSYWGRFALFVGAVLVAIYVKTSSDVKIERLRAERDAARDSLTALRSAVRVPQLLDAYGIPYTIMVGDSAALIHYGWRMRP